jgi:ribosomal protein S18 acetylase RimI-like enzyme
VLPTGYKLQLGFGGDRALLLKFLSLTYRELFPQQENFSHLSETVATYFSLDTPLWWVGFGDKQEKIACLWLGNAIDQVNGHRYSHIFLLYVMPPHRRQGIAKALIDHAQNYAKSKGHQQIGLQVYPHNQAALNLYNSLGYCEHSFLMIKSLNN